MNYKITHITSYSGPTPVSVCHNQSWLKPRVLPHQQCLDFQLKISPTPSVQTECCDSFGNNVHYFSFNRGYHDLKVTAQSLVNVSPQAINDSNAPMWESIQQAVIEDRSVEMLDAYPYVFDSPRIRTNQEFAAYTKISFRSGIDILTAAKDLTRRIFKEFEFDARATTVTTPVEEVFRNRRGVCQDFAHLQIALLRSLRLPVRYVSGYLRTIPPAGKPRLIGADASHAWVSLYCGGELGWVDLDPTNNVIPETDHITIAWGRDYSDVPPLRGVFLGGGNHSLSVSVDVEPINDTKQSQDRFPHGFQQVQS